MNRLYHFPLSPYCRKVRLILAEKRIEVELVDEKYWEPSSEFLRRNPAGQVPVLKIDGLMLSDSTAICEYLEETVPEPALMPKDPIARAEVRRLNAWFDDKFHAEVTRNLVQGICGMGKTLFGWCNVIHKVNAFMGKRYHNNIYL